MITELKIINAPSWSKFNQHKNNANDNPVAHVRRTQLTRK